MISAAETVADVHGVKRAGNRMTGEGRTNGRLIQVEFVSNVYMAGNKKVIQCNIRDITERIQVQNALLKSKALLREQSVRDHLTGLFNRRYMEETLERELLRASRKQLPLGIIMLDVDDFKRLTTAAAWRSA